MSPSAHLSGTEEILLYIYLLMYFFIFSLFGFISSLFHRPLSFWCGLQIAMTTEWFVRFLYMGGCGPILYFSVARLPESRSLTNQQRYQHTDDGCDVYIYDWLCVTIFNVVNGFFESSIGLPCVVAHSNIVPWKNAAVYSIQNGFLPAQNITKLGHSFFS